VLPLSVEHSLFLNEVKHEYIFTIYHLFYPWLFNNKSTNQKMNTSLNHEEQIDYIIDKFNFEKVRCVMLTLDWQWACTEGNGHAVPSIARLKAMARHLLRSSIKDTEVTSGGLYATYYPPENGDDDYFVLKFVVAFANSVDYNEDD